MPRFVRRAPTGYNASAGAARGDTWKWDDTEWTQLTPATTPSYSNAFGVGGRISAYDVSRDKLVMFLTATSSPLGANDPYLEIWEWDRTDWEQKSITLLNRITGIAGAAYDPVDEKIIVNISTNPPPFVGQFNTFSWDGTSLVDLAPATVPPHRRDAGFVYHSPTDEFILFGGQGNSGDLDDTWSFDRSTWTEKSPSNVPIARDAHHLVHNPNIDETLMFGGSLAGDVDSFETVHKWEDDDWVDIDLSALSPPCGRPTNSYGHGACYSPVSKNVILFGGFFGSGVNRYYAQTWEWDYSYNLGTTAVVSPTARSTPMLDFDGENIILFGGTGPASASTSSSCAADFLPEEEVEATRGKFAFFREGQWHIAQDTISVTP